MKIPTTPKRAFALLACIAAALLIIVAPAAARTLAKGSVGDDVAQVQSFLAAKGYQVDIDQIYGAETKATVARWQAASGLEADGIVGPETWGAMSSGARKPATKVAAAQPPTQAPAPRVAATPAKQSPNAAPIVGAHALLTPAQIALAGGESIQNLITEVLDTVWTIESDRQMVIHHDGGIGFGPLAVNHWDTSDVSEHFGVSVTPSSCQNNWPRSEMVYRLAVGYWAAQYEATTGHRATAEVVCKIWNGGPNWRNLSKTSHYWGKILKENPSLAGVYATR